VLRIGALVPVDRGNREAGIAAVREASAVLRQGISMTIFVEGKRSWDGKLLPFKKGPFYLAMECDVPVVPVTVVGTHYVMPKGRFAVKPGTVKLIFHPPIEQRDFGSREQLMVKVREVIDSGLPVEYRESISTTEGTADHTGSTRTA
jgi:1-acyl-sn-glycerol-3-phosphate acyltransferase